jgi:hypothetical protein
MLPKLEHVKHEDVLPVSGKTVKYRSYTISEEKALLSAMQNANNKQILTSYKDLINNCLIDSEFPYYLYDFLFLAMKLKSVSKGSEVSLDFDCPHCENKFTINRVDVDKCFTITNKDIVKITHEVNPDLTLELVPPAVDLLFDASTVGQDGNVFDVLISTLLHSIKRVVYKKNVYDNFTKEELLESIVSRLTEMECANISLALDTMVSIGIEMNNIKCPKCQKTHSVIVRDADHFLS